MKAIRHFSSRFKLKGQPLTSLSLTQQPYWHRCHLLAIYPPCLSSPPRLTQLFCTQHSVTFQLFKSAFHPVFIKFACVLYSTSGKKNARFINFNNKNEPRRLYCSWEEMIEHKTQADDLTVKFWASLICKLQPSSPFILLFPILSNNECK